MPQDRPDRRNMLQNALAAIERLQAQLELAQGARREPIAIVGMACRTPGGANDPDAYWRLLAEGRDAVTEVPADRWDVDAYYDPDPDKLGKARTKAGGFLDDIESFEPAFFGMSPREATGVDPQQRLLLEATSDALEHAGVPADQLEGSRTGVFVGITSMDYAQRIDVADPARSDIYLATGTALNAAAGRVSFTFGFRGPCMAIDTACSSSLVAIHTACQSLRDGESDLVVAGGVNVILSPDPFVLISKWGMLSPEGRCKTFDASADGFVRAEGCGLLVLERLSDAVARQRRILAVIPGSAINQDGRSSGLTVPNGLAQQEVVRQALAAARLAPTDVSYVEAHGTGTSLGDPIEVEALAAVYGEGRSRDHPLELGSVKSNIGHLEAASGVMSLIKLVLSLQHGKLPASLHVKRLTPAIDWEALPLKVSAQLHDWVAPGGRRIAGVSAFGFSGMNAHVIVAEAPAGPAPAGSGASREPWVLPLSARNDAALAALAGRYAAHLRSHPGQSLPDICATASVARSHHPVRAALLARDRDALVADLEALGRGEGSAPRGTAVAGGRCRVAFLFTGQGAQFVGMGRELHETEPAFREALGRCAAALDPLLGRSLLEVMFEETGGLLDQTAFTQPALFALEVALAATWRSWGIEPAFVTGHSVGEFAAAVVAGVLTLEDGARLIAARGRLMQALPARGGMVSVRGDVESVRREVAAHADKVSIAAFNAPGTVVIAGAKAEVEAIAARLAAQGAQTKALVVSHAFHSPLMDPMLDEFRAIAASVAHAAPAITWISNLTGESLDWPAWGARMADYWTRHVREPVAFELGMSALAAAGCDAHVEIGPHPILLGLGTQCIPAGRPIDWLPSLRRGTADRETMLESVSRLYVRGARPGWRAIHGAGAACNLQLPSYPFQRSRYLIPFAAKSRRSPGGIVHELLGERLSVAGMAAQFERAIDAAIPAWVADHRIAGEVVMPLTAYLEASLAAARHAAGEGVTALEAVEVGEALALREGEGRVLQVAVEAAQAGVASRIRVFSRDAARDDGAWTLHATAEPGAPGVPVAEEPQSLEEIAARLPEEIEVESFYGKLHGLGVDFGPGFRAMRRAWRAPGEALAEIDIRPEFQAEGGRYLFHPAVLDACLHASAVAMDGLPGADDGTMYLPVGVDRYRWHSRPEGVLRSHARVRAPAVRGDMLVLDLRIETIEGRPVARLEGLRCRRASRDMFRKRIETQVPGWLYELAWQPQPLAVPETSTLRGAWLVLDDGGGRGAALCEEIVRRGASARRCVPREAPREGALAIDADEAAGYAQALDWAAQGGQLTGIVSLWPLRVPALGAGDVPSQGQRFGVDAALLLLQAVAARPHATPPRLWIVTAGSQVADGTETLRLEQAPVAGLARVAATEHPELRVTLVDLDPQAQASDAKPLADEMAGGSEETQVAFRKGLRYVARLARLRPRTAKDGEDAPERLHVTERGVLENLVRVPDERRPPGPGQVELRVRASGLNFRDVLFALGMYPGEIRRLGSDCAGVVTAVGEGVTRFRVGDRVVAMAEGAFASHATTRWEFVAPLPRGLDFEQGASIPTAYLTADITLNLVGGMKKGDRVLIHSGAGGVGMAAIALARRAGAEIFATAGSAAKREVLEALGVHHALDSRSTSFHDDVMRITGGAGVHLVLNSLAGPLLDRSFECLADGGVFLEIGKRGVWTHDKVAALGRGIRYHIVDCNDNARDTPEIVGRIFTRVLEEIESGALPRLPVTTFAFENAPEAFRYMAQARHIGRVVFRHRVPAKRNDAPIRPDATYLVTGGLRGLGLLAAQWLAGEGARHLLLAGRRGPDAAARAAIASLEAGGVEVATMEADVASAAGIDALMARLAGAMPVLGGVIHCAGLLDDGVLAMQDRARFAKVMGPKADGAWRLHGAMEKAGHRPDFLVLYSSLSAIFGTAGQGNYVAANAFLDALAHGRRFAGLPALAVNWGAWRDVGMAERGGVVERAAAQGLAPFAPEEGTQVLGALLRDGSAQVAAAPIDWSILSGKLGASVPPLLSALVERERGRGAHAQDASMPARIDFAVLAPPERRARLVAVVQSEVAKVLGLAGSPGSIPADQAFTRLGMDSLTSVELRNRLQGVLRLGLPATAVFDWPTIGEMAAYLDTLVADASGASGRGGGDDEREQLSL